MGVQRYILILNMNATDSTSTRDSMEYYENRLKTFVTYPKQMLPDKIHLARAGLYNVENRMCANVFGAT